MFGSKKKPSIPAAVFDISSSSVGGAHVLINKGIDAAATILATSRIDALPQEDLDMKRFVSEATRNLEAVVANLHKADLHKPHRVELVLASPWYVSQTRRILYQRENPFTCTRKLFNSLVDDEITHIIKNELERFGSFGKEGTVVEKQISLVKLNGYPTSEPFGKKSRMIEIFLTVTVVPKRIIDQFTEIVRRTYGSRPIGITTSPYVTFVVARDYISTAPEALIIDVGEEVTDVAFVKGGLFLYQHSFPVGTYGFYRELIEKQKTAPAEVQALIEGYRLGKLSAAANNKIKKALSAFAESWQQALQMIIDDGHYGFCLPELCYITADSRFEGVFPEIIKNDPLIQHTCSRGSVEPHFITEETLQDHIISLDESVDIPLASAALFAARTV